MDFYKSFPSSFALYLEGGFHQTRIPEIYLEQFSGTDFERETNYAIGHTSLMIQKSNILSCLFQRIYFLDRKEE